MRTPLYVTAEVLISIGVCISEFCNSQFIIGKWDIENVFTIDAHYSRVVMFQFFTLNLNCMQYLHQVRRHFNRGEYLEK